MAHPLPTPGEKQAEHEHIDLIQPVLEGGHKVEPMLTAASEQDPEAEPDLQVRAVIVTIAVAFYWFTLLYSVTVIPAYSRSTVAALGDSGKQAWIAGAFNVVTVIAAPILSYASDAFGDRVSRKWFVVLPTLCAVVGAVVASRASSVNVVIVGTAVMGVAAGTLGIVTAIPSEILPHKRRSAGQAFVFTASAPAGFAAFLGPSHAIANDPVEGWRWTFYSLVICWAAVGLLMLVFYSPPLRETELTRRRPSLDYVGYALLAAATVLFLIGLTWGGVTYPWKSGHVLGPLVAGVCLFAIFGGWEWKGKLDGLLHHELFQDRNFALVTVAIFIEGAIYLGYVNTYPTMLATIYEPDVFKSGVLNVPFYGAFILSLPIGGWAATRFKDNVTPVIVGFVIVLGATIGFTQAKVDSKGIPVAMSVLAGAGFSQPLTFLTVIAQFATPPHLIATSTAVVLSVRALGGAVGTAVVNSIINSKAGTKLPAYIAEATLPLGLDPHLLGPVIGAATGDVQLINAIEHGAFPGISPAILGAAFGAAHRAFLDSIKPAWIFVASVTAAAILCCLLLKRNKRQFDNIIDAPLEHVHHRKLKTATGQSLA